MNEDKKREILAQVNRVNSDICNGCPIIDRLLKEHEAVEPEWRNGTPFCGNCGHRLEKKSRCTDGIKCPKCERTVKW